MTDPTPPAARGGALVTRWRAWLRQPSVHFLLLAGLLLAVDVAPARPEKTRAAASTTDDSATLQRLRAEFHAAKGRPMTAAEEREALQEHRYQQALFEAALATGMHETDPIVRRRLVQRMQFLIEDVVQVPRATDEQLLALVSQHPTHFPPTRNLTFEHVFFARSRHGAQTGTVAAQAREALLRGERIQSDPFPRRIPTEEVSIAALARTVGPAAAEAFFGSPEGTWSEPISTAYGAHLVRVRKQTARPPELEEVRARASAVWEREERERLGRQFIASLGKTP